MITVQEFTSKVLSYRDNKVILLSIVAAIPLIIFSIYYASSDDMEVLFSGVSVNDITKITMALDEKKIPYKVDLASSSVSVTKKNVHDVRMTLMSDGAILDSNVGFEIFNNSEFGMTEFSQKINYQRALQGELARTISSLKEIKYARVHIVQPKNRLFKAPNEHSSASITLFIKRGEKLNEAKIRGIQNIVSSSIENLSSKNVIITNQSGIVLSQNDNEKLSRDVSKMTKREQLEDYYRTKVNKILESSLGVKKFIASVNVELDYTKSTIRTENFLNAPGKRVIKRERLSTAKKTGAATKDIEYKVGKQIESIEPEMGRVKRISIGVLVPKDVTESQALKLKEVIQMAIGIVPERGDSIALFADDFSLNEKLKQKDNVGLTELNKEQDRTTNKNVGLADDKNNILYFIEKKFGISQEQFLYIIVGFIVFLVAINIVTLFSRKKNNVSLSTEEKEKIVNDLSSWFSKG